MSSNSSRSAYPSFWEASRRQVVTPTQMPSSRLPAPIAKSLPPIAIPDTPATDALDISKSDVLKTLAKKSVKDVRAWFREQVEGLDDSSD